MLWLRNGAGVRVQPKCCCYVSFKQEEGAWSRSAAHIPFILTYTEIVLSGGKHTLLYG